MVGLGSGVICFTMDENSGVTGISKARKKLFDVGGIFGSSIQKADRNLPCPLPERLVEVSFYRSFICDFFD